QQYREFESGIHHQDCCINEHRIEPGPADRPKESVPVLVVSDLVVGVDGETGQVVCDPEEQDEYHVDDEVRGARRYVRTGREGSSSGGEEWRNPKDLAGLEAEYVSKDEAEDVTPIPSINTSSAPLTNIWPISKTLAFFLFR